MPKIRCFRPRCTCIIARDQVLLKCHKGKSPEICIQSISQGFPHHAVKTAVLMQNTGDIDGIPSPSECCPTVIHFWKQECKQLAADAVFSHFFIEAVFLHELKTVCQVGDLLSRMISTALRSLIPAFGRSVSFALTASGIKAVVCTSPSFSSIIISSYYFNVHPSAYTTQTRRSAAIHRRRSVT